MTNPGRPDLAATLAKLRDQFLATSHATVAAFEALAQRLEAAPADAEALATLRSDLHRTHGTAGSYGFHAASRLAGAFEGVAIAWAGDAALDRQRRADVTRRFARGLRAAFDGAPDGPRALLIVDVADDQLAPLVTGALAADLMPQRAAASLVTPSLVASLGPGACVVAGAAAVLPPLEGVTVTRLPADGEPQEAIRVCCATSP